MESSEEAKRLWEVLLKDCQERMPHEQCTCMQIKLAALFELDEVDPALFRRVENLMGRGADFIGDLGLDCVLQGKPREHLK